MLFHPAVMTHPRIGLAEEVSHRYRTPANSLAAMVVGSFI
jgi:hypothetical protein